MKEKIHLEPVDPGNWRIPLSVSEEQKVFVSDQFQVLARAFAYREQRSEAFIIYAEDIPVGMVMYHDLDEWQAYDFSHFFIDSRYQGRGYGMAAAKLVLDRMLADGLRGEEKSAWRMGCLCRLTKSSAVVKEKSAWRMGCLCRLTKSSVVAKKKAA